MTRFPWVCCWMGLLATLVTGCAMHPPRGHSLSISPAAIDSPQVEERRSVPGSPQLGHRASGDPDLVIRAQSPDGMDGNWNGGWDGQQPMAASSYDRAPRVAQGGSANSLWDRPNAGAPNYGGTPGGYSGPPSGYDSTRPPLGAPLPPPNAYPSGPSPLGGGPLFPPAGGPINTPPGIPADLIVSVEETTTGRFMVGAGVNSDAGVTGQIVIDEQNFDLGRIPTSMNDVFNGTAFRGGGQRLRIEAMPGSVVQRYMVNFVEPYLFDSRVSLSLSGFLFDRNYFDWNERRLGARVGLGYRLTPDLSINASARGENVNVRNPRLRGVPELERVLGDNDLWSGKVTLTHDTRDVPFFPTQGHLLEFSYEQVFGEFEYPRGTVDYRKYFLLAERPDGSGRHVWANSLRFGVSGSDTPLFENFFAGGHTTMRGFDFRGASPRNGGITVGGPFSILGSSEYIFPITADDMLKGVVFCDYGTIEEDIAIHWEDFRVAVGFGLRITVPAMGPAPISLDLAVPISREDTDDIQNFSFYMGFGR